MLGASRIRTGVRPPEKVWATMIVTGTISRATRYVERDRCGAGLRSCFDLHRCRPVIDIGTASEIASSDDRHRGRPGHVVALDLGVDVHRGDLGRESACCPTGSDRARTRRWHGRRRAPCPRGSRVADSGARRGGRWCCRARPSEAAASSMSWSNSSSTGCTLRITNGSVSNRSASTTAMRVPVMLSPIERVWAVQVSRSGRRPPWAARTAGR